MIRGFECGRLCVYLLSPVQVWWGNRKLLELPFGWPNG